MDAIAFQKQFILAVCNTLESIFEDNYIIGVFKILDPTNTVCHLDKLVWFIKS